MRLGFFLLLGALSVFGALHQALAARSAEVRAPFPLKERMVVALTLQAPAPPPEKTVARAPEPEAKTEPKPKPKPKPKPEPSPEPALKPAVTETPPEAVKETAEAPAEELPEAEPLIEKSAEASEPQEASAPERALESYFAALYRVIAEQKRYPKKARRFGIEGEVCICFVIDDEGNIVHTDVLEGSGSAVLDRAALSIFEQIRRFAKPPAGVAKRHYEIVIDYNLS